MKTQTFGISVSRFTELGKHMTVTYYHKYPSGRSTSGSYLADPDNISSYQCKGTLETRKHMMTEALTDYRNQRENGEETDSPARAFPNDGKYTWDTPKETSSRVRYSEGPGDRIWMEEKDRNYSSRFARAKHQALSALSKSYAQTLDSLKNSEFRAALASCNEILSLDAKHSQGYFCRAKAHQGLKMVPEALADYHAAMKLEPKDAKIQQAFQQFCSDFKISLEDANREYFDGLQRGVSNDGRNFDLRLIEDSVILTDTQARLLAKYLQNHYLITWVVLNNCNLTLSKLEILFAGPSNILDLDVSGNKIGDPGAEFLAKQIQLRSLGLTDCDITDRGAIALSKKTPLMSLEIDKNTLSDVGVQALLELPHLTQLDVSSVNLSSALTLTLLTKHPSLMKLSVRLSTLPTGKSSDFPSQIVKVVAQNMRLIDVTLVFDELSSPKLKEYVKWIVKQFQQSNIRHLSIEPDMLLKLKASNAEKIQKKIDKFNQKSVIYTKLFDACYAGDLKTLQRLLKKSKVISPYVQDEATQNNLLHAAILKGHAEMAKWLQETFPALQFAVNLENLTPHELPQAQTLKLAKAPLGVAITTTMVWKPEAGHSESSDEDSVMMHSEGAGSRVALMMLPELSEDVVQLERAEVTYTQSDRIGEGGFGVVYKGRYKGREVAVKQLKFGELSGDTKSNLLSEAEVMTKLKHMHVLALFGVIAEGAPYCIVTEYMAFGALSKLLYSEELISWQEKVRLSKEVASGLAYLHSEHVLHRDLKSMNVLLDNDKHAKLSDFGLARVKSESVSLAYHGDAKGTVAWMAPELFERRAVYTEKSDVYSSGMVFFEIAARKKPFADAHNQEIVAGWIQKGEREDIPTDTPPKLAALITQCWFAEKDKRPQAQELFEALSELESSMTLSQ